MAAISSGGASSFESWITETRYCIWDHLLCSGALLVGSRSPLLRTPASRSDTAARISFNDFLPGHLVTVTSAPEQPSGDRCPECGSEHFFLCPVRSERGDS